MKSSIRLQSVLVLLFIITPVYGQDGNTNMFDYPAGLTIAYGTGRFAVTDEYISKEKYTGTLPYFAFTWSRMHETYGYRLEFMYRSSSEISNNNVSAEIVEAALNNSYLYPLSPLRVFGKEMFIYLGPASEFYFFYNKPKIAVSGFDYAQSFAGLLSLGGRAEAVLPFNEKLQLESTLGLAIFSLGLRMVDSEEEDVSPVKLLTLFAGTHGFFDIGIRYRIFNGLSVRAGYALQLTRMSSWNPLLAASDNLIATLTYEY